MFDPNDNEEQLSACELLSILSNGNDVIINDVNYELSEITDLIDQELKDEAMQSVIEGDATAVYRLYVNTVAKKIYTGIELFRKFIDGKINQAAV